MEINYFTKEYKKSLFENFLIIQKEFKNFINKDVYWIYIIRNYINNKIYIGKTKNITVRALNYINAVLKGDKYNDLISDMINYGINNFYMSVIEIAHNEKSASIKEKYFIDKFDSIESGYNKYMNSTKSKRTGRTYGSPQTLYAKVTKSKLICALNYEEKEIIFSTGLKLFGDFIGRHKDEIKSFAKRQTKVDGYFIYYLNNDDFNDQISSALMKLEKNSIYSDCNLQYDHFIKYSKYLLSLLYNNDNPDEFEIKFITQSNDIKGYKFDDIDKFISYYLSLENKILYINL